MMYIRYPLSLRQVEDILFERGIDICHETVRFWWSRHFNHQRHITRRDIFKNHRAAALTE